MCLIAKDALFFIESEFLIFGFETKGFVNYPGNLWPCPDCNKNNVLVVIIGVLGANYEMGVKLILELVV